MDHESHDVAHQGPVKGTVLSEQFLNLVQLRSKVLRRWNGDLFQLVGLKERGQILQGLLAFKVPSSAGPIPAVMHDAGSPVRQPLLERRHTLSRTGGRFQQFSDGFDEGNGLGYFCPASLTTHRRLIAGSAIPAIPSFKKVEESYSGVVHTQIVSTRHSDSTQHMEKEAA